MTAFREWTVAGNALGWSGANQLTAIPAGLELVLRDGRRLRISQGVQEETLRAVLAAMDSGNK